ncbi:MAG: metallophosphoesterase [Candidatus Hodarchaeota archaeon]
MRKPKHLGRIVALCIIIAQAVGLSIYVVYSQPYLYYQTVLGPYLSWSNDGSIQRNLSSTSMTISWRSQESEIGHLKYWSDGMDPITLTNSTMKIQHSYKLDNLTPGTKYYYKVGNELHESQALYFTTMETDPAEIRFSMWADTQPPGSKFRLTAPLITEWDPHFVIQSGDLVSQGGNWDYWREYLSVVKQFTPYRAFMPAPGNHETYGDDPNIENFREVFALPGNEYTYSYVIGQDDMLFIAINSGANGVVTQADFDWANQTLYDNYLNFTWIVMYSHHPPISNGMIDDFLINDTSSYTAAYWNLSATYDVDVVLTGHHHTYERLVVPNNATNGTTNITFYVAGGGGGGMGAVRDELVTYEEMHFVEHHVLHATVTDSQFLIETEDIFREIRDTHSRIPKNRATLQIPY